MEEKSVSLSEEKKNSIVLKKGVKGYNWDIKIYFDDDKSKAIELLKAIDNDLKSNYEE